MGFQMSRTVFIQIFFCGIVLLNCTSTAARNYPDIKDLPIISITSVEDTKLDSFNVEGIVIKRYKCPPCPYFARCKICMPTHIIVSGQKRKIFVEVYASEEFELNKKYIFSFKKEKSYSNSLRLIGYRKKDKN